METTTPTMTIKEACYVLRKSRTWVWQMRRKGLLNSVERGTKGRKSSKKVA